MRINRLQLSTTRVLSVITLSLIGSVSACGGPPAENAQTEISTRSAASSQPAGFCYGEGSCKSVDWAAGNGSGATEDEARTAALADCEGKKAIAESFLDLCNLDLEMQCHLTKCTHDTTPDGSSDSCTIDTCFPMTQKPKYDFDGVLIGYTFSGPYGCMTLPGKTTSTKHTCTSNRVQIF